MTMMMLATAVSRRAFSRHVVSFVTIRPALASAAPSSPSPRFMSDLPYHIVMGMPALSPTMESGTLSEWNVKEGESFIAGQSLAKIETDKASIDFEAQDDGCVAKLLVPNGSEDVAVGTPIMVTVEDPEDVPKFADFTAPHAEPPAAPAATPPPAEPVKAAEPTPSPPPPPPPVEPVKAAPAPHPTPTPPSPITAEPAIATTTTTTSTPSTPPSMAPAWGSSARVTSPIAKTLAANQKAYIDLYGSSGQLPL